jgi:hypothetical protein
MNQQYQPDLTARLEKSFEEADKAREMLTESMANAMATNCDLMHHGLVSAKGLEITTEMYRHMLGKLLRSSSGEVRAHVLDSFNQSMEKFWPRKQADNSGLAESAE